MISRINNAFVTQHATRKYKYEELIGCNKTELCEYLRSINVSNIDIELYPEWEPDHIKAIANFNLKDIEQQKECFNFKNLQVLSKHDNRVKYNNCERSERKRKARVLGEYYYETKHKI